MIWGETDFTYTESGIEVSVRHIPAWVCPHHNDAAFPPGVADELMTTIRSLIKVLKQTQSKQASAPQPEYLVRVTT